MNEELLRLLEGDIPLLNRGQLRFLDDFNLVVRNRLLPDDFVDLPEDDERIVEIIEKVSLIEENFRIIINLLKGGQNARQTFLDIYPKWKKVRYDGIEKLREISQSINTDRFNCNVSKLVGYCTSFLGGGVTIASAILVPFTFGLTTPLAIAGGAITAAGCATAIGTAVTETALLHSKVKTAQEIIDEDKKYFQEMNGWLDHAEKLEKALTAILEIDIVKDIIDSIKDLVNRGMAMRNDYRRLNYIERTLNFIRTLLPQDIANAVPIISVVTIVFVLVAIVLLLWNTDNRLVFDCAALTAKTITGIASLADDIVGLTRITSTFIKNPVLAKDVAKAVGRGAVAVFGMALDVAGITLTSIDIHNGSLSPEAEKISETADELEKEAVIMQNIYEEINQSSPN